MASLTLGTAASAKYQLEKQSGDVPLPRFGHTCCFVGNSYVVLFGGATGDGGRYTINSDSYLIDVRSNTWRKLVSSASSPGDSVVCPSPRAAHCACCVDNMQMVVYGGATGGGTLSQDELYLLDLRTVEKENQFSWMTVPVEGATPGKRYGHSMVYSKPLLIVFGGNNGQAALNDIWTLDVEKSPFVWTSVRVMDKPAPAPRVYHSMELCTEGPAGGMTVVFGGRTGDNKSLKDAWGLRQHRDGRWDWVEAPAKRGSPPEPRYQHCCLFYKTKLVIVGGRGNEATRQLPTSVYDTETCEWRDFPGTDRFRHSSWLMGALMFTYGGFDHRAPSVPTNDLQVIDLDRLGGGGGGGGSASQGQRGYGPTLGQTAGSTSSREVVLTSPNPQPAPLPTMMHLASAPSSCAGISSEVVVASEQNVRRVGIETLEEESRKVGAVSRSGLVFASPRSSDVVVRKVLDTILLPSDSWRAPSQPLFFLSPLELAHLCQATLAIIQAQPMLLRLRAPVKIYGDLHGQFPDLMRLFSKFGSPTEGGDIDAVDYLFLGDFVDRGSFSLETIALLFALKIRYPLQVHLVRGNHEDPTINALYGFKDECRRRLREEPDNPNSVWNYVNLVFEYLPCGAVVDGRLLCIHGGIGGSIQSLADIESLSRPLKVSQTPTTLVEQKVTDLLWSDPSDSDSIRGVSSNETRDPDGSGRITKFGPDRVHAFLAANPPLELIVRAHECVMDGFERFAGGKLITVFSATDYCGHHKNAGALLFVKRDLTCVPKLIYPAGAGGGANWDSRVTQQRPPTPPRARIAD